MALIFLHTKIIMKWNAGYFLIVLYIYIYIYIYTSAVSVDLQCNFIDVTFGKGQSMYCDSVTGH